MTRFLFNRTAKRSELFHNTFTNEQLKILLEKIERIEPTIEEYNLIFVGCVGCGKSTLCNLLYHLFYDTVYEPFCYPEFLQIEPEIGHGMLKQFLNGEKQAFDFQRYILHCWRTLMTKQPVITTRPPSNISLTTDSDDDELCPPDFTYVNRYDYRINIFERCCDDSVICFANVMNSRPDKQMTDRHLERLFHLAMTLDQEFNIPNYFNEYVDLYTINSHDLFEMLNELLDLIIRDINNEVTTRFVGIRCDIVTLMKRINARARPGESNYTYANIRDFYNHYELLYQYLSTHSKIERFLDIGKLVEPRSLVSENIIEDQNKLVDKNSGKILYIVEDDSL